MPQHADVYQRPSYTGGASQAASPAPTSTPSANTVAPITTRGRLAGQHPLPAPHAMAVCDWSVNTLTVPVATACVRSPDTVPTTTVKASANVSLFMVTPHGWP